MNPHAHIRSLPSHVAHASFKDALHNPREAVAVGSGWDARRLFAANSLGFGRTRNAADRPQFEFSPADHRPQGVMQNILKLARQEA